MGKHRLDGCGNTIQVMKSRRLKWAGHIVCMGERTGAHRVLVGET
jgi:hypothetical protein